MIQDTPQKEGRLAFRVTAEQEALIRRAAAVEGLSLTEFLTRSAHAAAKTAISEHSAMELSEAESRRALELLLHPPAPNERLRDAARAYASFVTDADLDDQSAGRRSAGR